MNLIDKLGPEPPLLMTGSSLKSDFFPWSAQSSALTPSSSSTSSLGAHLPPPFFNPNSGSSGLLPFAAMAMLNSSYVPPPPSLLTATTATNDLEVSTSSPPTSATEVQCHLCQKRFCNLQYLRKHHLEAHRNELDHLVSPQIESPTSTGNSTSNSNNNRHSAFNPFLNFYLNKSFSGLPFPNFFLPPNKISPQRCLESADNDNGYAALASLRELAAANQAQLEASGNCSVNKRDHGLPLHMAPPPSSTSTTNVSSGANYVSPFDAFKSSMAAAKLADRVTCDICHKDLCNKYFLRTHKLKLHGIQTLDPPATSGANSQVRRTNGAAPSSNATANSSNIINNNSSSINNREKLLGNNNLVPPPFMNPFCRSNSAILPELPLIGAAAALFPLTNNGTNNITATNNNNNGQDIPSFMNQQQQQQHLSSLCPICKRSVGLPYLLPLHLWNAHGVSVPLPQSPMQILAPLAPPPQGQITSIPPCHTPIVTTTTSIPAINPFLPSPSGHLPLLPSNSTNNFLPTTSPSLAHLQQQPLPLPLQMPQAIPVSSQMSHPSSLDSTGFSALALASKLSPSFFPLSFPGGGMEPSAGSRWYRKSPNQMRVRCDICDKWICNKYFLRTHKLNKHGLSTTTVAATTASCSTSSGQAGCHTPPTSATSAAVTDTVQTTPTTASDYTAAQTAAVEPLTTSTPLKKPDIGFSAARLLQEKSATGQKSHPFFSSSMGISPLLSSGLHLPWSLRFSMDRLNYPNNHNYFISSNPLPLDLSVKDKLLDKVVDTKKNGSKQIPRKKSFFFNRQKHEKAVLLATAKRVKMKYIRIQKCHNYNMMSQHQLDQEFAQHQPDQHTQPHGQSPNVFLNKPLSDDSTCTNLSSVFAARLFEQGFPLNNNGIHGGCFGSDCFTCPLCGKELIHASAFLQHLSQNHDILLPSNTACAPVVNESSFM